MSVVRHEDEVRSLSLSKNTTPVQIPESRLSDRAQGVEDVQFGAGQKKVNHEAL